MFQITNIAQDLPSLEFWGDLPCRKEHISVKLTESFCDDAHALIEELVENLYRPIKEYINTLGMLSYFICERILFVPIINTKSLTNLACRLTYFSKNKNT